jgi:hypothetical protein
MTKELKLYNCKKKFNTVKRKNTKNTHNTNKRNIKHKNRRKTTIKRHNLIGGNIDELLDPKYCNVNSSDIMGNFSYECSSEHFNLEENMTTQFGEIKQNNGLNNKGVFAKHPKYFVIKRTKNDDVKKNYYLLTKKIGEKKYNFTPNIEKIISYNNFDYFFFEKIDGDLFNLLYYTIPIDILENDMKLKKEISKIYYNLFI